MPALGVHPNGKWFAAQSMDNQILVFSASDRFKLNSKKRFAGHITAGYACQINFSPDGHYIIRFSNVTALFNNFSGDGEGKLNIWDWKTTKLLQYIHTLIPLTHFSTLQTHDGVCIGCEWHPIEPSRVVTYEVVAL